MKKFNPREIISNKKENRCKKSGCIVGTDRRWRWDCTRCKNCGRLMKSASRSK